MNCLKRSFFQVIPLFFIVDPKGIVCANHCSQLVSEILLSLLDVLCKEPGPSPLIGPVLVGMVCWGCSLSHCFLVSTITAF